MREGWGFAGAGHQVKGFMVHLLWPGILSCWSQHCLNPVAPLHRMSEGPKPHLEPPRPGGALPGRSLPWSPHSHIEACSRIRAGFLNETICLAFLSRLGLVRPSISPVRILVCLSPPAWPSHQACWL